MDGIGQGLRWLFTAILYPVVVIGIFAYLVISIAILISEVSGDRRIKRLTAALLPVTTLVFVLIPNPEGESFHEIFSTMYPIVRFLMGAIVGILVLEIGRLLAEYNNETGTDIYILFLSFIGVFMLYAIVEGVLRSLHVLLLGMVIAGGLHIIFRGPPQLQRWRSRDTHARSS